MSTFVTHIKVALIFGLLFAIGMIVWDFDHLTRCKPKNLYSEIVSESHDLNYMRENQSKGGCRGFTHELIFGIGFTAVYFGYLIHMFMDNTTFLN